MAAIELKYKTVITALSRLQQSILFFKSCAGQDNIVYMVARDSIIQRFEFSIELFWKYLRLYLEEHEKVEVPVNTPRAVIRAAAQARLISEDEAAACIAMINSRNLTSHMYKEVIAEQLAHDIPHYFEQMNVFLERLKP